MLRFQSDFSFQARKKLYFSAKFMYMRKGLVSVFLLGSSKLLLAQNEVGPDGDKLLYILIGIAVLVLVYLAAGRFSKNSSKSRNPSFFKREAIHITLEKDALYYPDKLTLSIKNNGNTDIDLDKPVLVFDNFWLKRKFKLKGTNNYSFYPLYLEKGKTHTLSIDLERFYSHDKRLKRFPKAKVILANVKGRKLGSRSVFLRKTLIKF